MSAETYLTLIVIGDPIQLAENFITPLSNKTPVTGHDKMCLGEMTLPDMPLLKLFGTVGPSHYHPIWDFVIQDFLGIVVVVDDTDVDSPPRALEKLAVVREHEATPPIVFAIQQSSTEKSAKATETLNKSEKLKDSEQIMTFDLSQPDTIKQILLRLAQLNLGNDLQ